MLPKGKLAGLIAIFAAIGLITATGAFTTVTAERTATVSTAGDASALLALNPVNTDYAQINSDGTLEIAIDGSFGNSNTGAGVNLNALTQIDDVFSITNQGTQEVEVWITTNGTNPDTVAFYNGTHSDSNRVAIDELNDAHALGVGDSVNVSMDIDTRDVSLTADEELINGITIHANATA